MGRECNGTTNSETSIDTRPRPSLRQRQATMCAPVSIVIPAEEATCRPGLEPRGPSEPCWLPGPGMAAFMRLRALENFFSWISTCTSPPN